MSNFIEAVDGIENHFLANPHYVSILIDTLIDLDNLIENTNDEINCRLSNTLKRHLKKNILIIQSTKLGKT